ncbi:MAG: hypothetical protein KDE61_10630, partial [Novosphingobium sp.]|nr:hypothetical protein [Novosphingobium sp.]
GNWRGQAAMPGLRIEMMTRNEIKDKRWTRPELTRLGTMREVAGGGFAGNDGNTNCSGKANPTTDCLPS